MMNGCAWQATAGALCDTFNRLKGHYQPVFWPSRTDFLLTKEESNAFAGTNLEDFLKRQNIDTLYFSGFLSSQCVFATAAYATHDFNSHIVTDLTSDHRDNPPRFLSIETAKGLKLTTARDMGLNLS